MVRFNFPLFEKNRHLHHPPEKEPFSIELQKNNAEYYLGAVCILTPSDR